MSRTQAGSDVTQTYSTPRWVKVSGLIALLLVLLVGFLLLTGGHGPGRHAPAPAPTEHVVRRP
jgi:hypothetical protein